MVHGDLDLEEDDLSEPKRRHIKLHRALLRILLGGLHERTKTRLLHRGRLWWSGSEGGWGLDLLAERFEFG